MKPLMLVSPAQAEALFDAFLNAAPEAAASEDAWLDEDTPDDFVLFPREEDRITTLRSRSPQAA